MATDLYEFQMKIIQKHFSRKLFRQSPKKFLESTTKTQPYLRIFPAFYVTRRFIVVRKSVHHLPLSSERSIQYTPSILFLDDVF